MDLVRKDVIILGDFNIDFFDKSNNDTKSVNRLISGYGLVKLINEPTRYGSIKDSYIDQIITNTNHILHAGVADLNISDHQMTFEKRKLKICQLRHLLRADLIEIMINRYSVTIWTYKTGRNFSNLMIQI